MRASHTAIAAVEVRRVVVYRGEHVARFVSITFGMRGHAGTRIAARHNENERPEQLCGLPRHVHEYSQQSECLPPRATSLPPWQSKLKLPKLKLSLRNFFLVNSC